METNNGLMQDDLPGVNEPWRQALRQVPKIGIPPAALWKRVLLERAGGATSPEIEEMSPSFPEWEQVGEEVHEVSLAASCRVKR